MLATKIVLVLQQFEVLIVCPKIFMPHILTIFHKNTHTCERSAIEIDEKGTLSFFSRKKLAGTKTDFVWRFIMGNVNIFS